MLNLLNNNPMKRMYKILCCAFMLTIFMACKSQQLQVCEKVTSYTQVPWIKQFVEKGKNPSGGGQLISIDRVTYVIEDSNTEGYGFEINYELVCCDIPNRYVFDCDGNNLTFYGGIAGCNGECSIKILSRTNIYTANQ